MFKFTRKYLFYKHIHEIYIEAKQNMLPMQELYIPDTVIPHRLREISAQPSWKWKKTIKDHRLQRKIEYLLQR